LLVNVFTDALISDLDETGDIGGIVVDEEISKVKYIHKRFCPVMLENYLKRIKTPTDAYAGHQKECPDCPL
jgi:hypothetical protein